MQVTLEHVLDIINGRDGNKTVQIASMDEVKSGYTTSWKSYYVALSDSNRSYLLLVSPLTPSPPQPECAPSFGSITLPALSVLLSRILDATPVPVPRPVALDAEGKWGFGWLLLRVPGTIQSTHPQMSLASVRRNLSPKQLARIELRLGTYLRALHGITNDRFGIPMDKHTPEPPSISSFMISFSTNIAGDEGEGEDMTPYSWQDTFTLRLEELLEHVCGNVVTRKAESSSYTADISIDVDELRRSLSRAIGSFLFDDVEMPRLIWVTGDEEDVIVSLTPYKGRNRDDKGQMPEEDTADIAYILPTFGRALWGDPLMEAWFLPPGPTMAINEGYFGGEEDGTLVVFPRHKTKRVWYTIYFALILLVEEMSQGEEGQKREAARWARSTLPKCIEILKEAPCY